MLAQKPDNCPDFTGVDSLVVLVVKDLKRVQNLFLGLRGDALLKSENIRILP